VVTFNHSGDPAILGDDLTMTSRGVIRSDHPVNREMSQIKAFAAVRNLRTVPP